MIRIFRTQSVRQAGIRKILLFQGRLPRYLTYATGEDPLDTNGILSPYGTAQYYNHRIQNDLAC